MSTEIRSAIDFYERHPISSEIILAKLKTARGHLNNVVPEELFAHDQDHYGGTTANDALAERAQIGKFPFRRQIPVHIGVGVTAASLGRKLMPWGPGGCLEFLSRCPRIAGWHQP